VLTDNGPAYVSALQFSKYEDGRWHNFYAPDRRPRFAIDVGEGFEVEA
jgi:hypothetical protein